LFFAVTLIVQKFEGTSVADARKIRAATARAVAAKRAGNQIVMVVSARGQKTDELIDLANEVSASPSHREMDMLLATGEQESVALMAMAIEDLGEPAGSSREFESQSVVAQTGEISLGLLLNRSLPSGVESRHENSPSNDRIAFDR
jgi:aspartokinase